MKVLITGATGLVGNELCELLLKKGCTIHYLTTSKKKIEDTELFKGFYWNPYQGEIDTEALEGVDVIVHLAGAPIAQRWTKANKQEILESRVLSTLLLNRTLAKNAHQVKHFVSASAIGIYPSNDNRIYNEEEKEIDDSFLGYVVAKWEDEVNAIEKLGIPVTKIRVGLVLSEKGGVLPKLIKPINVFMGAVFGSGEQYQSWIHISDLAHLFYWVIIEKYQGIYNAVAPYPVTHQVMVKTISKKLSKPILLPKIPRIILKLILGKMHYLLFASQNVSARKILNTGFQFKFPTLDKALDNLIEE